MTSNKIKNISPKKIILFTFVVYVIFLPLPFIGYFVFGTLPSSIKLLHTISPFFLKNYEVPSAHTVIGVSLGILLVDLVLALITYKIFKYKTVYLASTLILLGTFFPIYVGWSANIEFSSLPNLVVLELKNTKSRILLNNKGPLGTELEVAKIEEIEINITPKRIEGGDIYYITLDRQGTGSRTHFTYCHLDRSTPPDIKNGECYLVSEIELFDKMSEVPNVTTGKNLDPQVTCLTQMPEKTDCPADDALFEKEPHPYSTLVPLIDRVLPEDDGDEPAPTPITKPEVAKVERVEIREFAQLTQKEGNLYSITLRRQDTGIYAFITYCHFDPNTIPDINEGECYMHDKSDMKNKEIKVAYKTPADELTRYSICLAEMLEKVNCKTDL